MEIAINVAEIVQEIVVSLRIRGPVMVEKKAEVAGLTIWGMSSFVKVPNSVFQLNWRLCYVLTEKWKIKSCCRS